MARRRKRSTRGGFRVARVPVRKPVDVALFEGNISHLFDISFKATLKRMASRDEQASAAQVEAAIEHRALLLLFYELEGWAVSLSRWFLQSVSSSVTLPDGDIRLGATVMGYSSDLLKTCPPVQSSVKKLVKRSQETGVVSRAEIRDAITGCVEHHGVLDVLWRRGAAVNERTKYGLSALHFAAAWGAPQLVGWLLAHGANATARTVLGMTPLHVAAAYGSTAAAEAMSLGVPKSQLMSGWRDLRGRSPVDIALEGSGADVSACAALLRALPRHGDNVRSPRERCSAKLKARRQRRTMGDSNGRATVDPFVDASWDLACGKRPPLDEAAGTVGAKPGHVGKTPGPWPEGADEDGCEVPVVHASTLTTQMVVQDVLGPSVPTLIRGLKMPHRWRHPWSRGALISTLGDVPLRLEAYPCAEAAIDPHVHRGLHTCTRAFTGHARAPGVPTAPAAAHAHAPCPCPCPCLGTPRARRQSRWSQPTARRSGAC